MSLAMESGPASKAVHECLIENAFVYSGTGSVPLVLLLLPAASGALEFAAWVQQSEFCAEVKYHSVAFE